MIDLEAPVSLEDIDQAVFLQEKAAAEASLRAFVEQAWDVLEPGTRFIPGLHVDAVCEHLQAMMEGRIKIGRAHV